MRNAIVPPQLPKRAMLQFVLRASENAQGRITDVLERFPQDAVDLGMLSPSNGVLTLTSKAHNSMAGLAHDLWVLARDTAQTWAREGHRTLPLSLDPLLPGEDALRAQFGLLVSDVAARSWLLEYLAGVPGILQARTASAPFSAGRPNISLVGSVPAQLEMREDWLWFSTDALGNFRILSQVVELVEALTRRALVAWQQEEDAPSLDSFDALCAWLEGDFDLLRKPTLAARLLAHFQDVHHCSDGCDGCLEEILRICQRVENDHLGQFSQELM